MSEENEVLDLNDPAWGETYEGDPEADYNAYATIPEGIHTVRLEFQEDKLSYGKKYMDSKIGRERTMLIAPLNAVIQEDGEPYNGQKTKDWPTSLIGFRAPTSTIGDICRLVGKSHEAGISVEDLKKHFDPIIQGEPLLRAKYQWTGPCEPCRKSYLEKNPDGLAGKALQKASNKFSEKASLNGMNNWPEDPKGGFKSEAACPDCGEDIQARPVIKKYLALK